MPNRAARVVRQGLDDRTIDATTENWTFLADALANSEYQDGAIDALEHAVILTDKSVLHVRLAQAYMWSEEWSEVIRVAQLGLTKNDALHNGELNLALGIAQFRLGIFNAARAALDHAALNEKTRERAEQWLALLPQPVKIAHSNGG